LDSLKEKYQPEGLRVAGYICY